MRARTFLALVPVAFATVFSPTLVPAASAADSFPSQNCAAAAPAEQVANVYTVLGNNTNDDYAFADVVQTSSGVEVCFRVQVKLGDWTFEGGSVKFAGLSGSAVGVDDQVSECTNVVYDGTPGGTHVRIATLGSGIDREICITIGMTDLHITASPNGALGSLPTVALDCCTRYTRTAAFPAGGSASSLCGTPRLGSSYLLTQGSASFVRRDEPTNSVCFRSDNPVASFGGRLDTFTAAGYMVVGLDPSVCTETVVTSGLTPPLFVRVGTSAGFDPQAPGSYLCVQVNGTSVVLQPAGVQPALPVLTLDA